ncbi:MAG TPA: SMP-30/gluconolactonase/LRE family protein [Hanamia sp.]|nr:SMP-30/gluconolactonase/LRE family protein [Hanamia sp.]
MKVDLLFASQCILGESPLWHAERKCCYWVDIERGILYEYNWLFKTTRKWKFNKRLGLVREGKNNQLILALDASIARFDLETEQVSPVVDIESPTSGNRCNDGACDSLGRLWIGTMHLQQKQGAGSLYMVDEKLKVHKRLSNTSISNGITWSLDKKRLYFIDSPTQVVKSFLFNEKAGEIIFEKNVIEIPVEMGTPDGMAIDEEGMLWIAHWGGFGIYRWNPLNGKLLDKIELPVPQITSCAFAGEKLDHLIITSARENFTQEELEKYPESGNLFIVKMPVKGLLQDKCIL